MCSPYYSDSINPGYSTYLFIVVTIIPAVLWSQKSLENNIKQANYDDRCGEFDGKCLQELL